MKVAFIVPSSLHTANVARDLVYGCWCKGNRIGGAMFPPISLSLVATVVREAGHEVQMFDMQVSTFGAQERAAVVQSDAVVVLSSTPTLEEDTALLRSFVRENPELIAIAFGGAVKFEPQAFVSRGVKYAVTGEAEAVIPQLLDALENDGNLRKVGGMAFYFDGELVETGQGDRVDDLDLLPVPDRDWINAEAYPNPQILRHPWTTVFTNRGCPARCTFCSSPYYQGRKLRLRSAESIFAELQQLIADGYKEVFFRDETFPASRKRIVELCQMMIDANLDLTWVCSSRVDTVDHELLQLMKRAGCHTIRFGVESGVQELLDNVKKDITLAQIRETFAACHAVGVRTHAHMMLGLPGETKQTMAQTFDFIDEIDPTTVTYGILTPYPGTPLFDDVARQAPDILHADQPDLSRIHTHAFYNEHFTSLTETELEEAMRIAYRRFYLRPKYLTRAAMELRSPTQAVRAIKAGWRVVSYAIGRDQ